MRRIGGNNSVADEIVGAALNGQQKYAESIAAFQNAVAAAPQALQPMVLLVRALVRAKQTDRAVSFLQTVLKSNPANAEAYVLLGSIARTNGALDQAAKSFMTAIDKQPNNSIGYRALAELYLAQNKTDAALATLRAGLKLQPDNAILHMALAAALERAEDYDAAIPEYEYVLAQQPGHWSPSIIWQACLPTTALIRRAWNGRRSLPQVCGIRKSRNLRTPLAGSTTGAGTSRRPYRCLKRLRRPCLTRPRCATIWG